MTRVNDRIRAPKIRVVDGRTHEQLGIMSVPEALHIARQRGLDLVEVSADAKPPVCKIVDYGKYKYEQSKNAKDTTKQKGGKVKEVKFRANISENDYLIKLQHAEEFLSESNKLRVVLQFRGREGAHPEIGFARMMRIVDDLKTMSHLDMPPRQAGRAISMALSPLPTNQRVRRFAKPNLAYIEDIGSEEDDDRDEENTPHLHTLSLEAVLDEMEEDNGRPKKRKKAE